MSDISLSKSPALSITSFSTACTSSPPTEITPSPYEVTEEKIDHQRKRLVRNHGRPSQRREITSQTLLLSSPLATLIYTASSTAAALPLTNTTSEHIPPKGIPVISEKGNVLRKKRARGGRPERLVRMGGPEVKVVPDKTVVDLDE
jgi:hypothetical protein